MPYIVKQINSKLGPLREVECEDGMTAEQLVDEMEEDLWIMNRNFVSRWEVEDLLNKIGRAIEMERIDDEEDEDV